MSEDTKEVVKEAPVVVANKEDDGDFSIFITDNDTFDVEVECYYDNGVRIKGIDTDYDITRKSKIIHMTLKRPSQGDCNIISRQASQLNIDFNITSESIKNLQELEFIRMVVLARKWNQKEELTAGSVSRLDTKIVKGLIFRIREKIQFDGII